MNRDTIALVGAVVLHGLLGVALAYAPARIKSRPKLITVDVRKKEVAVRPPEPPPPEPPKPQPKQKPQRLPPPNKTAPPPPPSAPPPKPVFGLTEDSTTKGDSSFSVPLGNTTQTDPRNLGKPGPVAPPPLPPAPPPGPPPVKPASPLDVASDAEPLDDPLSNVAYPDGEAKNLGIEGATILHVLVDDAGSVHEVKIKKSVGGGRAGAVLDQIALREMRKYRFKPARDKRGKPIAVDFDWTVNWELNR